MVFFNKLWQKVFLYSLILVIASSAMGIFLIHRNLTREATSVVLLFTAEVQKALTGQTPREAHLFLMRFNNQEARFWLENEAGELIAGERFAGRTGKEWRPHLIKEHHAEGVNLWQTDLERPLFIAVVPCELAGMNATLYATYMAFPVPPLETLISPSILTLALISGLLALWIALTVSRPLRRLRQEVTEISGSPSRLRAVAVTGRDEIADVAGAVNRLVNSLKSHIDGMNQLLLNASHELRSPITRMALSVEMIGEGLDIRRRQGTENEKDAAALRLAESNFAALRREIEHMDKLIGDTLLSSKLDLRKYSELAETVDISRLAADAAQRHEALFRQAEVRFMRGIEPGLAATGDSTLLTQVFSNLLDNALKYVGGDEPGVRMRLFREGDAAVLSIENTVAAPLPADALEHLFDPYYRHNQQTSTGVGLGLAIVKKIMTLHGGSVAVSNTEDIFSLRLSLPLAA